MRLAFEILGLCILFGGTGYAAAVVQEKIEERKAKKFQRTVLAGCGCFWCK